MGLFAFQSTETEEGPALALELMVGIAVLESLNHLWSHFSFFSYRMTHSHPNNSTILFFSTEQAFSFFQYR
jgi:hypothetical protein